MKLAMLPFLYCGKIVKSSSEVDLTVKSFGPISPIGVKCILKNLNVFTAMT